MANTQKRQCKVCGAEYDACYSCDKLKSWKMHTDTEDHFYVFCVLMDYQVNQDARKAYSALRRRGFDLRNTEGLLPHVRKLLSEIDARAHDHKKVDRSTIGITEQQVVYSGDSESQE